MSPYLTFKILSLVVLIVILIVVLLSKEKNRSIKSEHQSQKTFKDDAIGKSSVEEKDELKLLWLWEEWKEGHQDAIVHLNMHEYGHSTDYLFIRSTIKNKYPEWRVIDISDNKYIQSLGYVSNDQYAVYESSATIINRAGETKKIIFHTIGRVLLIY